MIIMIIMIIMIMIQRKKFEKKIFSGWTNWQDFQCSRDQFNRNQFHQTERYQPCCNKTGIFRLFGKTNMKKLPHGFTDLSEINIVCSSRQLMLFVITSIQANLFSVFMLSVFITFHLFITDRASFVL